MFIILETIVLFVIFGNSVYDCSEIIGNYTKYKTINEKSCGISLFSSELKLCFKYHNDLPLNLKDTRNAITRDAPWEVLLMVWKRYNGKRDRKTTVNEIHVHLNPVLAMDYENLESEYKSTEPKYVSPKFIFNVNDSHIAYDIGLFKMNKAVTIQPGIVNPICLPPERNFTYFEEQYAMITGWHSIYKYKDKHLSRLQIANLKVSSHTKVMYSETGVVFKTKEINGSHYIWPGYIFGKKLDKQKICAGDSGSPVWQYYLGRAVLVRILSQIYINEADALRCQYEVYTGFFFNHTIVKGLNESLSFLTWVPLLMDWITNTIQ